jgi:hypothetical protein
MLASWAASDGFGCFDGGTGGVGGGEHGAEPGLASQSLPVGSAFDIGFPFA